MICDRFSPCWFIRVCTHRSPSLPPTRTPGEMLLGTKQLGGGFFFLSPVGAMRVFREKAQPEGNSAFGPCQSRAFEDDGKRAWAPISAGERIFSSGSSCLSLPLARLLLAHGCNPVLS